MLANKKIVQTAELVHGRATNARLPAVYAPLISGDLGGVTICFTNVLNISDNNVDCSLKTADGQPCCVFR